MKKLLTKIPALLVCIVMLLAVSCQTKGPDVSADRYGAAVTPGTGANADTPLVIGKLTFGGKFSPFFYMSASEAKVIEKTQILLLK